MTLVHAPSDSLVHANLELLKVDVANSCSKKCHAVLLSIMPANRMWCTRVGFESAHKIKAVHEAAICRGHCHVSRPLILLFLLNSFQLWPSNISSRRSPAGVLRWMSRIPPI